MVPIHVRFTFNTCHLQVEIFVSLSLALLKNKKKEKQVWKLVKFFYNTYDLQTNMTDAISKPISRTILKDNHILYLLLSTMSTSGH